ncbi:MAG: hypothetical protein KA004_11275 [Verrucomicrobiales bacterium]|nr:hypothetical protein [Verrucomicrobiales bacterium]
MNRRLISLLLLVSTHCAVAGVTPNPLDRKRYTTSVTITATGTAATLDGAAFPLNVATAVTSVGYHELTVTDPGTTPNTITHRFIIKNSERGGTEDGIPTMRPYRIVNDAPSAFASGQLLVMAPSAFPKDLPVPVVARLVKGPSFGATAGEPLFLNGIVSAFSAPASSLRLRRGWGSTILPPQSSDGALNYDAAVGPLSAPKTITIENATSYTTKGGAVAAADDWGSNARIHLTSKLTVGTGGSVTIGAGTIVKCAQGVEIEVAPGGSIQINGTVSNPVVFVPEQATQLWGGFWLQPTSGGQNAQVSATGTIFCRFGNNQNWLSQSPHSFAAHRNEEPCFAVSAGGILNLTDCALVGPTGLADTRGSAFAMTNGTLNLTRTLAQRCITGGEQVGGTVEIHQCALLEMTNAGLDADSDAFADADNDGIYLVPGSGRTYHLSKTVIGWVKDDGIDSGADGAGATICTDCWFENCTHEAFSNSGVGRVPETHRGVHFNCGQGMECGYGGPLSVVDNCAMIGCMVGARYGDNYGNNSGSNGSGTSQYSGTLTVQDSFCLYNYFHDTWAKEFSTWNDSGNKLTMTGTKVSKAADLAAQNGAEDSGNSLWNAASDGAQLAAFMPVPGSAVGADFTTAVRQDILTNLPASFTVRLSTFSSLPVSLTWKAIGKTSVDATATSTIASGVLSFEQGETVKIFAAPVIPNDLNFVQVALSAPANAQITGTPLVYFPASSGPPPDTVYIARGAAGWRYHSAAQNPVDHNAPWPPLDAGSRSWTSPDFVETASWSTGTAPFGWGSVTGITLATTFPSGTRPITAYFRKTFTVADPALVKTLNLECLADDGASVYVNGVRVSPTSWGLDPGTNPGGTLYYDQLSSRYLDGSAESTYHALSLTGVSLPALRAAPLSNVVAIEVHQNGASSGDMGMDAKLSVSFQSSSSGGVGILPQSDASLFYWLDPGLSLETSPDLNSWFPHPEMKSPVPLNGPSNRMFFRVR